MSRSTYGSVGIARYRYVMLQRELGDDHPATRAARGRYLGRSQQAVPQRGSVTIEAIAWYRESGAIPGYQNRRERLELSLRKTQAVTTEET